MLGVVGGHARRRQNHFDGGRRGIGVAGEVVGIGFDDEARIAFLEVRRLALAGVERQRLGRLIAAPEEAVGRRLDFGQRKTRAALFDVGSHAAHAVRVGDLHRDRSGHADDLDLGTDGERRVRRHGKECDRTDDDEKNDGYDYFHISFLADFLNPLQAYFFTQESIQSMNVLYQRMLFCGFNTQWPSSGKIRSFDGTFCICRAVNSSRP